MALAILLAIAGFADVANAADAAATAARISDGAFTMLNAVDARDASKSNSALGAVAIFAGDAHSLSDSIAAGDRAGAASDLAALEGDRAAVDGLVFANPGLFNVGEWNRIKSEMAALSKQLATSAAPVRTGPAPGAASGNHSAGVPVVPPALAGSASVPTASADRPESAKASDSRGSAPPNVVIESRSVEGSAIHVKGYLEGSGLKHGGIYAGSHELRDFKVGDRGGEVRLNFDIGVERPTSDEVIRVFDAEGRMAQAPIADATVALLSTEPADLPDTANSAPEIPAPPASAGILSKHAPSIEDGVKGFHDSTASGSEGPPNTAEIPSHGTPRPSPSKRHTIGGQLGNVKINISAANQIAATPPTFQIIGQIVGHGITRAGIYIEGRLVTPITVEFDDDATNFDEKFTTNVGQATIRAYGVGDQYVQSSVDLSTATASADASAYPSSLAPGTGYGGPMVGVGGNSGLLVQIAAVGPITPNLYVVSGVISGAHLSAAGLYQNGMLVQRIPIGGGIGGVISSLIPGASHNVNFNVRFNPQAGAASIRAFDSSGGFNEQPVVIGGMNPYVARANPYGANPYGSLYGTSPYGMSPYGSYGTGVGTPRANPSAGGAFGLTPISPLSPAANPFASPPASSSW